MRKKKNLTLIAAASLAVGGLGFVASMPLIADERSAASRDQGKDTRGTLPQGITRVESDEADDIRDMLADAVEAALDKNDLDDFIDYFVDADRNRIGDWKVAADDATLKGRIDQIQQAWRAKYGRWVNLNGDVAFGPDYRDFVIVQGEITNPALLSNWPVPNEKANLQGQRLDTTPRPGNEPGDRNLEKGREVAVISFPAAGKLPAVNVSLINEAIGFGWKIDVPDNVSGQQLRDNLLLRLTKFGEMHEQWPSDPKVTQRMLAHCVLAAVYGVHPQDGQQR